METNEKVEIDKSKKPLIIGAFDKLKNEEKDYFEVLQKEEFYLQKGKDAFDKIQKTELTDKELIDKINLFVAYCDVNAKKQNAANKDFNEYTPKRFMSKAMIRQHHWEKNLRDYLKNKEVTDVGSFGVMRAIKYFENPAQYLSITSKNHLNLINKYFLQDDKENGERDEDLIKYFDVIFSDIEEVKKISRENKNVLYTRIIYNLRKHWGKNTKFIQETQELLENCHNVILTGAPGTGKTYLAKKSIGDSKNEQGKDVYSQVGFVQFHPTFDYTDFVEGLKPIKDSSTNSVVFERQDGIFKKFCKCAILGLDKLENVAEKEKEYFLENTDREEVRKKASEKKYLFVIDEINRGDISKIFGELFFSIDPGYRVKNDDSDEEKKSKVVQTQYQILVEEGDLFYDGFYIPENVYIIGTMNDIDRSVESMDFALRRRFAFKEISVEDTQYSILTELNDIDTIEAKMNALNDQLKEEGLSESYYIGAAYFKKIENYKWGLKYNYEKLWNYHIKGLLYEYFRGEVDIEKKIKRLKNAYDLQSETK